MPHGSQGVAEISVSAFQIQASAVLIGVAWVACGAATPQLHDERPAASQAADIERASVRPALTGDRDTQRRLLEQALERDAADPVAHARLAQLTGLAPRQIAPSFDSLVDAALDHPYDPWALARAGEALARRGRNAEAVVSLERTVWLADLDPEAALGALRRLAQLDAGWRQRRVVPVHVYADDRFRGHEGWRFRLRTLWLSASNSLEGVLQTRFVPIAVGAFSVSESEDLIAMHTAFVAKTPPPEEGILAAITERPASERSGGSKKGVAEFLGRSLTVRVPPRERQSRVLAHEILHLYGAVHVIEDVDSLMNPTGTSYVLDAPSLRIVRALRGRAFRAGGIEDDVLPWIELREAVDAYLAALEVNLYFREVGIKEAWAASAASKRSAAQRARQAAALDPQLADTARIIAVLMLSDGRRAEALPLLDLAAQLYGKHTQRGREVAQNAEMLRESLSSPSGRKPAIR